MSEGGGPRWYEGSSPDDPVAAVIPERHLEDRLDVWNARRLFRAVATAKGYGTDDLNLRSIGEVSAIIESPSELNKLSMQSKEVAAAWRQHFRMNYNAERFRSLAAKKLQAFLREAKEVQ